MSKRSLGLETRVASTLCYALGWVTGVLFLILENEDQEVRFHAYQSLATFGGIAVLSLGLGFLPMIGMLARIVLFPLTFILWIVLMVKAYQGEHFRVPIAGDWAEQQR